MAVPDPAQAYYFLTACISIEQVLQYTYIIKTYNKKFVEKGRNGYTAVKVHICQTIKFDSFYFNRSISCQKVYISIEI